MAYRDGSIEGYFPSTGQMRYHLARGSDGNSGGGSASTVGLFSENFDGKRNVLLCSPEGIVELHRFDLSGATIMEEEEEERGEMGPEQHAWNLAEMQKKRSVRCDQTRFKVHGPIGCMRVIRRDNAVVNMACSGRDNLLAVYDLERQKSVFRARNQPADYLGIMPPVWDRDITYMHAGDPNPNLIATCTAYHQIRLYDIRDKTRRPVHERVFDDKRGGHSLTCIAPSYYSEAEVFVGNAIGRTIRHSFHAKLGGDTNCAQFKGNAGSVRQIQQHPQDHRFVATISADRFVRVFDHKKRNMLYQMFLVEMQTAMLFTNEGEVDPEAANGEEDEDEDEDGYSDRAQSLQEDDEDSDENMEDASDVFSDDLEEGHLDHVNSDEDENDEIFGGMRVVRHKDKRAAAMMRQPKGKSAPGGSLKKLGKTSSRSSETTTTAAAAASPSAADDHREVEIIDSSRVLHKIRKARKIYRLLGRPMPVEIVNPILRARVERTMKAIQKHSDL